MKEMILCVPKTCLPDELTVKRVSTYIDWKDLLDIIADGHAQFLPRDKVETNDSFKQIIPYVLIKNSKGSLFCYSRAGSEERLRGQLSLGIGGHINREDAEGLDTLMAVESVIRKGIKRELEEETGIKADGAPARFLGVINEEFSPVGTVHLGLVFEFTLPKDQEISPNEEVSQSCWLDIDTVRSCNELFELWSRLALELAERE